MRVLALPLLLAACFTDPRPASGDTSTGDGAESSTQAGDVGSTTAAGSTSGDAGSASGGSHGGSHGTITTTTTATTAGTASTGDPQADDGACALYCGTILSACGDGLGQYPAAVNCVHACQALPPGEAGAMSGNSLACRREHAALAIGDPQTHCVHAGPGGAGVCGTDCEGFCAIATATCPNEHPELGTCLETCTAWNDDEPYDVDDATGDTLACRLYHLMVAAADAPSAATHCPHTVTASPPCK